MEANVANLRKEMEIAQMLAKHRISFVVVPALTPLELTMLYGLAAQRLEKLALKAEKD